MVTQPTALADAAPSVDAPAVSAARKLPAELPTAFAWLRRTPYFQAGLQGYSDQAMRLVARRHGAPYCVTEALLTTHLVAGGRAVTKLRPSPEDHPLAGQLIGAEPADLARSARLLIELGYDVIDLNLACPVKRTRTLPRGGQLLADPDHAITLLETLSEAVKDAVPLTVKLRRGTDDSPAAEERFQRIFARVVELGYFAATVHGRTVSQKYVGDSDWRTMSDLVQRYPGFVLFGSGDIFSAEAIYDRIRTSGVRAVSVARGAIANPWIFRQAAALLSGEPPRAPNLSQQRETLEAHCEEAVACDGDVRGTRQMRKFGIYYSRWHPQAETVAKAFVAVKSLNDWRAVLSQWYDAETAMRLEARAP